MAQLLNVQLQDANGNIYYLQTSGDSVFLSDGTTVTTALQNKISTANIDNNLLGTDPTHVLASPQGKILSDAVQLLETNLTTDTFLSGVALLDTIDTWDAGTYIFYVGSTCTQIPVKSIGYMAICQKISNGSTSLILSPSSAIINELFVQAKTINGWRNNWTNILTNINIQSGITAVTADSGTVYSVDIDFEIPFLSTPTVVASLYSGASSTYLGNANISVTNVTTTGFTLKFFNASPGPLAPSVNWIAHSTNGYI